MNRVTKRTWLMGLFLLILIGGMGCFLFEYVTQAGTWVTSAGSPHVYNNGNLGCGTVVDRSYNVLLDLGNGRTYSADPMTRRSTLHWIGDRGGAISARAVAKYASALSGYDLVNGVYNHSGTGGVEQLTISARVQNAALKALASQNGRKGTVGVYNYKTGEILCAVTSPTFDPDYRTEIDENSGTYLNRFLQGAYIPGSTYKLVTCAAALDCVPGIEQMHFTCYGEYSYGSTAVTCETAHGTMDMKQALANSCNCAFAQVAEKVGKKNMRRYVEDFQVTKKLSFDGVTTAAGKYDISDAGPASFAWSCIGQHTDLINPCRYMTFMGQIAGGGVAAMPYLVERVESDGQLTYQAQTSYTDRVMSENLAQKMREFMRNNVEVTYGSWKFPGMTVCAKSGTAQLGGGLIPNALFAGFVADPQYPLAFIVVVENGGYGSNTCIPILQEVLPVCKAVMDGQ